MKYLMRFSFLIFLFGSVLIAQELTQVYKTGKIKFITDDSFQSNADFFSNRGAAIKNYLHIAITRNGRSFVLDRNTHEILVFGPNGDYEDAWKFDIPISTSVYHRVNDIGIVDDEYLVVAGYAQLLVYSFEKKLIRRIKMDYPVFDMVGLKNNKVAVRGYILDRRGNTPKRRIYIGIIDIENGTDREVTYFEQDINKEKITVRTNNDIISFSSPARTPEVHLASTLDHNLIVGYSGNQNLLIFSPNAQKVGEIEMEYPPIELSDSELQRLEEQYIETAKRMIENETTKDSVVIEIQSGNFFYEQLPYFYGIKSDSDGNILVFRNKEQQDIHSFRVYQVYSANGDFICETTVTFDPFKRPDLRQFEFGTDYLYGIFENSDTGEIGFYRGNISEK